VLVLGMRLSHLADVFLMIGLYFTIPAPELNQTLRGIIGLEMNPTATSLRFATISSNYRPAGLVENKQFPEYINTFW